MRMHSNKFKDPMISRPQPVTIITPVVEETLRNAGVASVREHVVDRFMNGQPRIAVVHAGEDHPPNVGSKETIRRLVRHIWANGGIPFEMSQAAPCEELCQGTDGMNYALLSRNFYTASLAAQVEAHGYDGAIVLGVCDKMMVGSLRALIEARLPRPDIEVNVLVPYTRGDLVARMHEQAEVLHTEHTEGGTLVHARVDPALAQLLRPFRSAGVP